MRAEGRVLERESSPARAGGHRGFDNGLLLRGQHPGVNVANKALVALVVGVPSDDARVSVAIHEALVAEASVVSLKRESLPAVPTGCVVRSGDVFAAAHGRMMLQARAASPGRASSHPNDSTPTALGVGSRSGARVRSGLARLVERLWSFDFL